MTDHDEPMVVLCHSCGKPIPEDWGILADDGAVWCEKCFDEEDEPLTKDDLDWEDEEQHLHPR